MKVLVTGAASGIGLSVARRITSDSRFSAPQLFLVDRDEAGLAKLRAELEAQGVRAECMVCDLTAPASADAIIDRMVNLYGGVDAIVSNAGGVRGAPLKDLDVETYTFSFDLNTRPTWLLGKAAHSFLKASRGAIVATASIAGTHVTPPLGTYSASKAALITLVRQMAVEWGADGIRCNTVSPGPTVTGITQAVYDDPQKRQERIAHIPLQRLGDPADIAEAILFLIHPSASHITGVDIVVDGGLTAALMRGTGSGSGDLRRN